VRTMRRTRRDLEVAVKALAAEMDMPIRLMSYQPDQAVRYALGVEGEEGELEPLTHYLPLGECVDCAWSMIRALTYYKKNKKEVKASAVC